MRDPKVRGSIQNEFSLWLVVQINERGKTTMIENRSTTIDIFTNYDVKPIFYFHHRIFSFFQK